MTREQIIENGVNNLRGFGYPEANSTNILTDAIYSAFFKRLLTENLGNSHDEIINELLNEIS